MEKEFTGRKYCEEEGIELYFNTRDHRFLVVVFAEKLAEKEYLSTKNPDHSIAFILVLYYV
jgi:glycerol-3-phosphate cytidylyltransferase